MGGKLLFLVSMLLWSNTGLAQEGAPSYEWDEHGYVLYCPCMGRFGNQASHFLGALSFAKRLNRTLALPPWRSYVHQQNVPFTDWFKLEPVQYYHKSLPLEDFIEQLAPEKWPPEERTGYCYRAVDPETEDCQMKKGNPFGPFWDELGVGFNRSVFTGMTYDVSNDRVVQEWMKRFPPTDHPVLAFKGAPARFPVLRENRHLQKYVKWSDRMTLLAEDYINGTMGGEPYISIHLRIGSDWVKACEHAIGIKNFMESPQCLEDSPQAVVTQDMCLPSREVIVRHIKSVAKKTGIKNVFVASDVEPDIPDLQHRLGTEMRVYYLNPDTPQLDLTIMGKAHHFIGNCVSSFSAFVKRERDVNNSPSSFFGIFPEPDQGRRTEL